MATNVPIFVENYQTGYRPSNNIPINGRQQTIGAVFNSDSLVANVIGINGGAPEFVNVNVGPPMGPYVTISDTGSPYNLGGPTDIAPWVIVAFVPWVNSTDPNLGPVNSTVGNATQ